jgi:hypothetical protein
MIKKIIQTSLLLGLTHSFLYAAEAVHFNVIKGDVETKYEK